MAEQVVLASSESTANLWNEKIEQLSSHAGTLERKIGDLTLQVERWKKTLADVEAEVLIRQQHLDKLMNKETSGVAAVEEAKARLVKQMEEAEAKANARIEAADKAGREQEAKRQVAAGALGKLQAYKADALVALQKAKADVEAAVAKAEGLLSQLV